MSKKQEIYTELLRLCLPEVRNSLSHSYVVGRNRKAAYELSQLTHDLYVSILEPNFIEHDFWFLNVHAKSFFEKAKDTPNYLEIIGVLGELFREVPEHDRRKLEWEGP